ncbi:flavodoxin family protein [Gudongella sp. DL1XJH-153]|uniref:flavodoxin family protein n=1 Tax=Gudongella sp. DL1XJH-153 TaxID=3409804 RepID=UPI003BB61485
MKIGIIVHSMTGNTSLVAERLKNRLEKEDHEVFMERLKIIGGEDKNQQDANKIGIEPLETPLEEMDLLIFGGPVRGFQASPAIKALLGKVEGLEGKDTMIFVTHAFPFNWMGGNSSIKQMKSICTDKGANILFTGIIDWKNSKREMQIDSLVGSITRKTSGIAL